MPVSKVAAAARAFVAVPPALARSYDVALKVTRGSSPPGAQEAQQRGGQAAGQGHGPDGQDAKGLYC